MLKCFTNDTLNYILPVDWHSLKDNQETDFLLLDNNDLIFYRDKKKFISANDCYQSMLQEKHLSIVQLVKRRGKLPRELIDGTGGWGKDALSFAQAGIHTTVFERQELPVIFMHYALQRWFAEYKDFIQIHHACFSQHDVKTTECVYLDPMFFDDKKCLSKKSMQSLYALYPSDKKQQFLDLKSGLLKISMDTLIMKQPRLAEPWIKNHMKHERFNRTCRFDIYYINKKLLLEQDMIE
jgi:hypothetical protein